MPSTPGSPPSASSADWRTFPAWWCPGAVLSGRLPTAPFDQAGLAGHVNCGDGLI